MNLDLTAIDNWRRVLVRDERVAVYEGSGAGWHVVLCTLHAGEDADCTATAVHVASGQVVLLSYDQAKSLRREARYRLVT